MTPKEIRKILLDRRSNHAVARDLDRSAESVRQVRAGIIRANVHPEIPRWNQPQTPATSGSSCYRCQHWRDHCTFGYPDPLEEGPTFAQDCAMYSP